jgi:DNA-binding HxlR family transcriptional regulator
MGLKLQLVRDGRVIFESPLDVEDVEPDLVRRELEAMEPELKDLSEFYDVLSNETRMRMMFEMVRTLDRRFAELMQDLDVNQKIVWDGLRQMKDRRMVEKVVRHRRNVHYVPSRLGFASFMVCAMVRRIMDETRTE